MNDLVISFFSSLIDIKLMSGLSAVLAYFLTLSLGVMAYMTWRMWPVVRKWREMTEEQFDDVVLNASLFLFFAHSAWQRAGATLAFIEQEWRVTIIVKQTAPLLTFATVGMGGFLWWASGKLFHDTRRWWWCTTMWSGLALCLVTYFLVH
jgi:hypothetical protein